METAYVKTPIGYAEFQGDSKDWPQFPYLTMKRPIGIIPDVLQEAVYQFTEYFEGKRKAFDLSLNPQGTAFQKRVWNELISIPYGKTISYLELAKRLGDAKAIRAVAAANGRNPLWVIVPCHRVIGSNGDLVGYAGGLSRKKWLLEHESPVRQHRLF